MEPADQPTPPSSSAAVDSASVVRRGRPSRILLAAVLTELIVIAAVGNQSVTHALSKKLATHNYADYTRGGLEAAMTFSWRFAAQNGQPTHVWAAQFAAIGTLVILTILGVLAVGRGVVTFGRVFIAVWAVVAAVTPVAIMVRELVVVPSRPGLQESRIGQSVYAYPDFGPVIVAGLVLGLVVGLITALIAVITRRKPRVAGPDDGENGEYLYSGDDATSAYQPPPWGVEPTSDAPTSVQPRTYPPEVPQSPPWGGPQRPWEGETAQLPTSPDAAAEPASEQTQQFATTRQTPPDEQAGQPTSTEESAAPEAPAAPETAPEHPAPAEQPTQAWQAWSAPAAPPASPSAPPPPPQAAPETPSAPPASTPADESDATAQIPVITDDEDGRHSQ